MNLTSALLSCVLGLQPLQPPTATPGRPSTRPPSTAAPPTTAPPAQQPAPRPATGAPQPAPTGQPAGVETPRKFEDFPPAVRLGVRAEAVRRGWPVIPIVVVVPDEVSYLEAIAQWTPRARFPVLIDDGTETAREDIARFVRGFEARSVVRWSVAAQWKDNPASAPKWPADAAGRRAAFESAMLRAWSMAMPGEQGAPVLKSQGDLLARWKAIGVPPVGIVVADADDPAWPAAFALAVGRCQPVAWLTTESNVNAAMPLERLTALETGLEAAAKETGLTWAALGDDIDAVTLCLNCPVKVQLDGSAVAATTDIIARHTTSEGKPATIDKGDRWGWAGQIFGTQAESAYRAMCAIYMSPRRAWLFDGYPNSPPWNQFDCGLAAKYLTEAGYNPTLIDTPQQGEKAWRLAAARGVDAGFICVNTKGNADEFNLEPGQCRPGDVPFLRVPAIVYMVHSWSAAMPTARNTVAGRWLERGAYAYMGSTQEPYLQAFVPTPTLCARMASAYPWGAAVRPDNNAAAWKLATLGDPLIVLGAGGSRTEEPLPLKNAVNVEDSLREALAARNFRDAIVALTILGRDADAARLAAALWRDEAALFTVDVARAAVLPAMRAGDMQTIVKAFGLFTKDEADPVRRDALWQIGYDAIIGTPDSPTLTALRSNMRPDQVGRDAADLARPVASAFGRDAAVSMLTGAKPLCQTQWDTAKIDEAIKLLTAMPAPGQR
jgi:hypothetical protein